MTAAINTLSLKDPSTLEPRDLDARVAEVLFGIDPWAPKRCMHTGSEHHEEKVVRADVPHYSTTWDGFGAVYTRLRELGHGLTVYGHPSDLPKVQAHRRDYSLYCEERALGVSAEELSRAACIAALRVIEGAGQ